MLKDINAMNYHAISRDSSIVLPDFLIAFLGSNLNLRTNELLFTFYIEIYHSNTLRCCIT
ncbi:hypothetical protein HanIR_Chr10g0456171 [Helianthus annuus]|nr:hypothetical protein HanIR_Chr10g0456171 [Helianthus annuus]